MTLQVLNLNKRFDQLTVYHDFNLEIRENAITCMLGPSGCGKTTLLNMISRSIKPDSGKFIGFNKKSFSYIYQEPRLLPWKTVYGNIEFVLRDKYPKEIRDNIVKKFIHLVGLAEFTDYYPGKLSAGMKQRVSIARAFAYPADVMLMDEPFQALDMDLKKSLIDSFIELWLKDLRTIFFVTHDIDEALLLGDDIYILDGPPVKVIKKFEISTDKKNRDLKDEDMINFKQSIIK